MTPREASRYLMSLLAFAGKPDSEVRLSVKTFVDSFIHNQVDVKKTSDIELCSQVKQLNSKCVTAMQRIHWMLDRRAEWGS